MIKVRVTTVDLKTGEEHSVRLINYHLHSNRRWLIQHMSWALTNGYGVACNNMKDDK